MSRKPYQLSNEFEISFFEIQDWLWNNETLDRTQKIIQSLLEKLNFINENPEAFPTISQKDAQGNWIRKAVHFKTYIILYSLNTDFVEFVAIYHGKRQT
jgi:plasmid stabilization system protein ParE